MWEKSWQTPRRAAKASHSLHRFGALVVTQPAVAIGVKTLQQLFAVGHTSRTTSGVALAPLFQINFPRGGSFRFVELSIAILVEPLHQLSPQVAPFIRGFVSSRNAGQSQC